MNNNFYKFESGLQTLININGIDNELNIPDYMLAKYLVGTCLNLRAMLQSVSNGNPTL